MAQNAAARLKDEGVDVKKTDVLRIKRADVFFPPRTGHPLSTVWHPRGDLTIADAGIARLVDEIVEARCVRKPVLVREDWIADPSRPSGKRKVFVPVDGAGRIVSAGYAEARLHERGLLQKDGKPAPMYLDVDLFVGDDKALLRERQRAQSDPSKRPHSPGVLAVMTQQSLAVGDTIEEIAKTMPAFVNGARLHERDVEAFPRWENLHTDVRTALDAGTCPFGLFRVLLDEPRDTQPAKMAELIAAGVTHAKGATKLANATAKRAAAKPAGSGPVVAPSSDVPHAGDEVPVRRPHPKAMRVALEGATGCELTAGDLDDNGVERGDIADAAFALGFVFALKYALGDVSLEELPNKLVPNVASHITKAVKAAAKKNEPKRGAKK